MRGVSPAKGRLFVPSHAAVLWHTLPFCAVRAVQCCDNCSPALLLVALGGGVANPGAGELLTATTTAAADMQQRGAVRPYQVDHDGFIQFMGSRSTVFCCAVLCWYTVR